MKKWLLCIYFLCIFYCSLTAEDQVKQTICLNMIVKDESKVITRCLSSVKPLIDYWVIVDTGSTDGTQDIIKEFMKDIPGELHERPWINFGHNRNEALQLAKNKADYIFFIDADEVLNIAKDFSKPKFNKDLYYIVSEYAGTNYCRVQLVKNALDWQWEGVLHETLSCPDIKMREVLKGVTNIVNTDGARSADPQKYHKDAMVLEAALKEEPNNSRYMFYLAQSYRDAKEYEKALEAYKKRIAMGGWNQEVFHSKLQVAHLHRILKAPPDMVIASYEEAHHYRPSRVEPLYYLSEYYRSLGNPEKSYETARKGKRLPISKDLLFVEKWIYDYGLPVELIVSSYWTNQFQECLKWCQGLLAKNSPEHIHHIAAEYLGYAKGQLISSYQESIIQASLEYQKAG